MKNPTFHTIQSTNIPSSNAYSCCFPKNTLFFRHGILFPLPAAKRLAETSPSQRKFVIEYKRKILYIYKHTMTTDREGSQCKSTMPSRAMSKTCTHSSNTRRKKEWCGLARCCPSTSTCNACMSPRRTAKSSALLGCIS